MAIATFLFFTGLVAVLSWYFTRHDRHDTSTGYFLAGRSLAWFVVGGSLLLTNLSTEQLVGLNGGGFKDGMETMAWELGASIAMVVMALFCLPVYLRGGIITVPQYLEARYSKVTRELISLVILMAVSISVLPYVLYSGALFMVDVFRLPRLLGVSETVALWSMVISLGVVGSAYAIFGGLRAVAISDSLNGVGLLIAGILIPLLGLSTLGDGSILGGVERLTTEHVDRLDPFGDVGSGVPASTLFTGVTLLHLYYWCTNQFIVQRAFGSRSLQQGQKGVLFAASMKLLGPFYLVLPGVIAYHLYADQIDIDGNLAYSTLVRNVLPKPLVGFFAAAIFGAILSSFNSALNSCATLFSVDLYKGILNPQATDQQMVRVGKGFGLVLAAVIIGAAPGIAGQGAVFESMKKVAATFDVPLMAIVFVGIFSRRTPAIAAWAAILSGIVFYSFVTFVLKNEIGGYEIHWLHVAGLNFALMMGVMAIVRLARPLPDPYQHGYTKEVDIRPWPAAKLLGVAIVAAVIGLYTLLWSVSQTQPETPSAGSAQVEVQEKTAN